MGFAFVRRGGVRMDGVWFYGAGCYFLTRRVWGGEIRGLERERERERVLGWGVSLRHICSLGILSRRRQTKEREWEEERERRCRPSCFRGADFPKTPRLRPDSVASYKIGSEVLRIWSKSRERLIATWFAASAKTTRSGVPSGTCGGGSPLPCFPSLM